MEQLKLLWMRQSGRDKVVKPFKMWVDNENMKKFGIEVTATPEPERYDMEVFAFHDYDGDGVYDPVHRSHPGAGCGFGFVPGEGAGKRGQEG